MTDIAEQDSLELKPCPFCGEKADAPAYLGFGDWHVACSLCTANVEAISPVEAAMAWNARPEAADTLSQMRDALDEARRLIAGLECQFDHQGCTCTFPSDDCCSFARADATLRKIDAALTTTKIEKE